MSDTPLRGLEPTAPSWRSAAIFGALVGAGALSLLGLLILFGSAPVDRTGPGFWVNFWDDLLRAGVSLAAGLACWRRGRLHGDAYGPVWRAFGMAMFFSAAGAIYVVIVADLFYISSGWITLRHGPYLLSSFCMGLAALRWPTRQGLRSRRLQAALDGLLIAGAAFFMAWDLLLRDLLQLVRGSALYAPTLAYPSLAIATAVIWFTQEASSSHPYPKGPLAFMRAAVLLHLFQWSSYSLLIISGKYQGAWADLVSFQFLAVMLCLGLGALWPCLEIPNLPTLVRHRPIPIRLPFLPALGALAYAGSGLVRGHSFDDVSVWTAFGLVALLCWRQYLTLRDLQSLSGTLERRVEERTAELRHSQEALLRQQRMQMVAAMAAGLAHDLKNLITITQNWVNLLRSEGSDDQLRAEGLGVLQGATDRASHLVHRLLDAGRPPEPTPRSFDLGAKLEDLNPLMKGNLPEQVHLALDLPRETLRVYMDPDHLEKALLNLVSNAADVMPHGGTITLRAYQDPAQAFAVLEVADTGPGMSEEVQSHLFEPFFTTKAPGLGTGLGLLTVQNLLLQAGGEIRVQSRDGVGTTFCLRLPQTATNDGVRAG